jgi:hypothetical protein
MLKLRVTLKEQYQPSGLDEQGRKQFWDQYCKYVSLPLYLIIKRSAKTLGLGWRPPPLVEVTREMMNPRDREQIVTWMVAMSGCRMLQINPWSNSELLKERFDQWLCGLRKEFDPPFKRRGRPGANIRVTKLHLNSWANHSILAVFDLDFHSKVFGKRPLSRSDLHEKINPVSSNAAEWAKNARVLVQRAVKGLEFLIVQAQSGAE